MNVKRGKILPVQKQKKLLFSDYLSIVSFLVLCISILRTGHKEYYLPITYLISALLFLNIFCIKKIKFKVLKPIMPFAIILVVVFVLQNVIAGPTFSIGDAFSATVLFDLFLVSVLLLSSTGLRENFWKIINFISIAASIAILIEYVAFCLGIKLYTIPVLGEFVFHAWEFNAVGAFRPCAFFSEASHYAEFVLLSAFYYLYIKESLLLFSLIVVSMIVSTSALGILGCVLLIFCYVFFFAFSKEGLKSKGIHGVVVCWRELFLVLSIVLILVLMVSFQVSDSWLVTRIMNGGTLSMRVNRSFELYSLMSPLEQLFGIGLQNQAIFLNSHGIVLPSDLNETLINREYAATAGYILCTCGLTGLVAFLYAFIARAKLTDKKGKVAIGLIFYIIATSCVLSRSIFILLLLVLLDDNMLNFSAITRKRQKMQKIF